MNEQTYDAIVVGAGLMGASVAAALVKSGRSVLLLDAHERGHELGSSHGYSRVTRRLSSEARVFPETAEASLRSMLEMEKRPGVGEIVRKMPAVFVMKAGSPGHIELLEELASRGSKAEEWSAESISPEYGFKLGSGEIALIDREAAVFDPSKVLSCLYDDIRKSGAPPRFNCEVINWSVNEDSVTVTVRDRSVFRGKDLVLATGAWTPEVAKSGDLADEITEVLREAMVLVRVPVFYFPYPENMRDAIWITLFENDGKIDMYAMPEVRPDGAKLLKVGFHRGDDSVVGPNDVDREVSDVEKLRARDYVEARLGRKLNPPEATICLYAMRRNDRPFVGRLPGTRNVYVSTYGGGNCAKHAIALGHALFCRETPPSFLDEFEVG